MSLTQLFFIPVASLLLCMGIDILPEADSRARAAESGESLPAARPPIVGGTGFPSLEHYEDPSTRTEVWSVSPPRTDGDDEDASRSPIYVSPEIKFSLPGDAGRPRLSPKDRP